MGYSERADKAKAKREAALEKAQTKRELAKTRLRLAESEYSAAIAYRNKLIVADAKAGLSSRQLEKLWELHWTNVAEIVSKAGAANPVGRPKGSTMKTL